MKNLAEIMKQAGAFKARMEEMHQKLEEQMVTGQSGGGLVKLGFNGKGALKTLYIDASLLKEEEKEIVEDLLIAAHADGRSKIEALAADLMQEVSGGLSLPPGFNLPF